MVARTESKVTVRDMQAAQDKANKARVGTHRAKMEAALLKLLHDFPVRNEAGACWTDFENKGRDCSDFAGVSRKQLELMLTKAFQAGAMHATRHTLSSEDSARIIFEAR